MAWTVFVFSTVFFFAVAFPYFAFDSRSRVQKSARRRIRTFDRGVYTHKNAKCELVWLSIVQCDPINCERTENDKCVFAHCHHVGISLNCQPQIFWVDCVGSLCGNSDKCDFTRIDMVCGDQSFGLFFAACNLRVRALSQTANASSSSGWLAGWCVFIVFIEYTQYEVRMHWSECNRMAMH